MFLFLSVTQFQTKSLEISDIKQKIALQQRKFEELVSKFEFKKLQDEVCADDTLFLTSGTAPKDTIGAGGRLLIN